MIKKFYIDVKRFILKKLGEQLRILIKNSSWVFIANLISSLCVFLRAIVLGRILGAELYGTFILVVAFVVVVQEFFNLNIGTALIKFGAEYRTSEEKKKLVALIKICFLFAAVFFLLSLIFIVAISHFGYDVFIKKPGLKIYMIFYAVGWGFGFFDYISMSLLRLYYKFKLNSLIIILTSVSNLLFVGLTAFLFPKQLPILFIVIMVTMVLKSIVVNGMALWELRNDLLPHFKAGLHNIRADLKRITSFIFYNSGSRTVQTLTSQGDFLILGALTGSLQVGYYGVAKKLAFSILRLIIPLNFSIYPQLALLISQKRFTELKKMLEKLTKLLVFPLMLGIVCLIFFNKLIIVGLFGPEYGEASKAFFILFISSGLNFLFFWKLPLIQGLEKVDLRLLVNIIALLIGALIAYILAPLYGASGVAVAVLGVNVITISAFLFIAKREIEKSQRFQVLNI